MGFTEKKKLQLVYALVSSEKDIYLEQAYVSMYSARYYNPDARIIVVVDELTNASFVGRRKEETRYADDIIVVKVPTNLNGQRRSRILKTSIRKYVKGDFLFIDCDTIVVKSLVDILEFDADLAACYDSHCADIKEDPYYPNIRKNALIVGTPIDDEEHYFNSGVIWVRDVPSAHKFYEMWNNMLAECVKKNLFHDQPSFKYTDYKLGHIVKPLPDVWNVELKHGIKFLKDSKIVHYLCTNKSNNRGRQFFIMNDYSVLDEIKHTGVIPRDVMETIKDPFYGISPLSHCFAGEDVYFFSTQLFRAARFMYGSKYFKCLNYLASKYLKVAQKMKNIRERMKKRSRPN